MLRTIAAAALTLYMGGACALTLHVSAAMTAAPADAAIAASANTPAASGASVAANAPVPSLHGDLGLRTALRVLATPRAKIAAAAGGQDLDRIDIDLGPGTYRIDAPLHVAFDPSWRGVPVTISGAGEQATRLSGALPLTHVHPVDADAAQRLPAQARGHVIAASLPENGVTDPGTFTRHGFGIARTVAPATLYYRDEPVPIAHWPDAGYATIDTLPDGEKGLRFVVRDAPFDALANALKRTHDLHAFGFWARDWADTTLEVDAIDPASKTVTLKAPAPMLGLKAGQRVAFENALELLDAPGEWYVDTQAKTLYFWPPAPLKDGDAEVSVAAGLFVLDNAPNVTIRNLAIDGVRGNAIQINGASNIVVDHASIRNAGGVAVWSTASDAHFRFMHVANTGEGGFVLFAGNRKALTPGNVSVEDSEIHDYALRTRTYRPAIALSGVGDRIERNHLYDGPHAAIIFAGNDHVIAGNEIDHVARDADDTGAIYTGRDWTSRGTVIENNFMHDIGSAAHPVATMGIYLDDQAGGTTIRRNVFSKVNQAVFIGGGRDNLIEDNLFVNCTPAIHIDSRGLTWQRALATSPTGPLQQGLALVNFTQPPYSTHYPSLATVLTDAPGAPKGNVVRRNAVIGGTDSAIDAKAQAYVEIGPTFGPDAIRFAKPMTDDARSTLDDLRLARGAPALQQGFDASTFVRPAP
ncbi:right-handed parallel beta-helix repeat-containing protein [Pararobbsia silviterrae]|nr:right-handed parallel beta-helix repeat-containing protein [Pararobbsia silviterrae]